MLTSSQESGSEGEGLAGPSGRAKVQGETAVGRGPHAQLALAEGHIGRGAAQTGLPS